jgi:hypothetical protein
MANKGLGGVKGVGFGEGAAAKSLRHINRDHPTGEPTRSYYF